jgi:hypothetical protein
MVHISKDKAKSFHGRHAETTRSTRAWAVNYRSIYLAYISQSGLDYIPIPEYNEQLTTPRILDQITQSKTKN